MSMLEGMSCHVTDLGILPDDEEIIAVAIGGAAKDHHVIVTSGGVSAGEEDHVKGAVERHGVLTSGGLPLNRAALSRWDVSAMQLFYWPSRKSCGGDGDVYGHRPLRTPHVDGGL